MNKIKNRLKKIEGQIRGLQQLIDDPKNCEQLIIQFSATKSALDNCFALLLETNLTSCLKQKDTKDLDKILKLIIKK
jgi:DNA-binding FrmR family transcriptional regulator